MSRTYRRKNVPLPCYITRYTREEPFEHEPPWFIYTANVFNRKELKQHIAKHHADHGYAESRLIKGAKRFMNKEARRINNKRLDDAIRSGELDTAILDPDHKASDIWSWD